MSSVSPDLSNSSMNASMTSSSRDIDEETKNLFKDYKIMSKDELVEIIEKCKDLITESEEMSNQRKWLIRRLIDLRYRFAHINALREDIPDDDISIAHHNFKILKQYPSKRIFCDFCTNIIWMFQQCYSCVQCYYFVHTKCLKYVTRTCAHVIVSEKGRPEFRICPEIGLSMQMYRCAECKIQLMNKHCYLQPRQCFYSGLFYCKNCHWNDYSIIPGNIIHNWDFEQRAVSRSSLQEINLFYERPVIKLEEMNPKLFVFVQKLVNIRQKRTSLMEMKRYLDVCKFALKNKIVDNVTGSRRYLVQSTEFYSVYDMVCAENSSLTDYLNEIIKQFKSHIAKCEICKGQGFICELCGQNEPIYPFNEGVHKCDTCSACFHRSCMMGLQKRCPRCERLKEKKISPKKSNQKDLIEND
ncbi:CLUMA_CG020736, isoform A [Clunio marinus]|uniref:CLUMA_CG020736, isoform A n=1 Tax=Clunio marinus TaxID=568069 RepID=A0A1J1J8J3_9DIPT|nr:CLUMA_CG020736, isoform A [Clunio marinus]